MECIKKVIRETGMPVYAIEDEGAIIVEDGKITSVGNVHYYSC
jgi:imidazolonepropionase-like amidohydrolase